MKLRFRSTSSLGGLETEHPQTSDRDISTTITSTSRFDSRVTIDQWAGMEKVDAVSMLAGGLPASPMRAGDYKPSLFILQFWGGNDSRPLVEWEGTPTLTYDEVEWTGDEKLVLFLRGRISGEFGGGGGPALKLEGTFQFVDDRSSVNYFRLRGQTCCLINSVSGVRKPWVGNDCPDEILAPFDEPYAFGPYGPGTNASSFTTKAATFACDVHGQMLCHAKLKDVAADGCTWRVQALTDGNTQQFAVSAWANEGCARTKKFCNAWR